MAVCCWYSTPRKGYMACGNPTGVLDPEQLKVLADIRAKVAQEKAGANKQEVPK